MTLQMSRFHAPWIEVVVESVVMAAGEGLGLDAESEGPPGQPRTGRRESVSHSPSPAAAGVWQLSGPGVRVRVACWEGLFFADQRRLQCTSGFTQLSSG